MYRIGVDKPPLPAGQRPRQYCTDMEDIQAVRLQQDVNLLAGSPGPAPAAASNLFTFMASRLAASFANLICGYFGLQNQVSLTSNAADVVVAACSLNQVRPLTPGPSAAHASATSPAPGG